MKVLMTADAVGGVWTYSIDLARGLSESGVEVVLAVMGPPPPADAVAEAEAVPGLTLVGRELRLEWMRDCWDDVKEAGEWLLRLEQEHRPDVIHLNNYAHGCLDFDAPVIVVGHSCVYGWWEAVHGTAPPPHWGEYRHAVREGLKGADLVVAPTAAMLHTLERHYGPFSTPMVTVPNGRQPLTTGSLSKDPMILWVGRVWDEAKDVALIEKAAARGLRWPVLVVGDPSHPEGRPPQELQHVHTTGQVPIERLRAELERAAVYVSTARYEPFGLGALEAAQAGCALVLPRIPSLEETWADVGLFYRPGDAVELQYVLDRLASDRVLLRRRGEKARRRAQGYSHQAMAEAYLGQYRRLIADRPATQEREAPSCAL